MQRRWSAVSERSLARCWELLFWYLCRKFCEESGDSGLLKWLARHKLARARYKYLSGHRSQAVFEKYKSYRLLVLDLQA